MSSNEDVACTEKFQELLDELERCTEIEQKQIIEEMNEAIDRMDEKGFESISATELFNKVDKMIEEKIITMENAIVLLKHVGYYKVLLNLWNSAFRSSLLCRRFEKMIIDKNEKNKKNNENLLVDLCECHAMLHSCYILSEKLLSICVPCILKVALKKKGDETTQKEVEMALLALSCLCEGNEIKKNKYLKKIQGIIKYHQKHHNLTHVAYQSAWSILMHRYIKGNDLTGVVENGLCHVREVARELEELTRCVDWKRKEKDAERRMKMIDFVIVHRWLDIIGIFFECFEICNEVHIELLSCMTRLCRAARENHINVVYRCCGILVKMIIYQPTFIVFNDLLKSGVFDFVLMEIHDQTFDDCLMCEFLIFFAKLSIAVRENEVVGDECEEWKKTKRRIFDKMEEEGYEDDIASFYEMINIFSCECFNELSLNISDYFVNV